MVTRIVLWSVFLISILFKTCYAASISYHVWEDKEALKSSSWTYIKTKLGNKFASCKSDTEYTKLVNFLKSLDDDVVYYVGIKIVDKAWKTAADGAIQITQQMALLYALQPEATKTYYLHWKKDNFFMTESATNRITASSKRY